MMNATYVKYPVSRITSMLRSTGQAIRLTFYILERKICPCYDGFWTIQSIFMTCPKRSLLTSAVPTQPLLKVSKQTLELISCCTKKYFNNSVKKRPLGYQRGCATDARI